MEGGPPIRTSTEGTQQLHYQDNTKNKEHRNSKRCLGRIHGSEEDDTVERKRLREFELSKERSKIRVLGQGKEEKIGKKGENNTGYGKGWIRTTRNEHKAQAKSPPEGEETLKQRGCKPKRMRERVARKVGKVDPHMDF
ncbi:unnamed protein product [Prunus armeniaca]|uniref:Uncharacterized protein n=1 Tax=Prunus armeniaca TaxID=36596 RepID=A0A6J5YDZ5_PRUAR|nr:unnamed protein product [Prunus armeniaca]